MLKVKASVIAAMEKQYPGIREEILRFDNASLPACPRCGSTDTADVQIGLIGRTINIVSATTKFKLVPNGPAPGKYFCNVCDKFFNEQTTKRSKPQSRRK